MGPLRMFAAESEPFRRGRLVRAATAMVLILAAAVLPALAQADPPRPGQPQTGPAQEQEETAAGSDSNPTQSVLFSPRLEYYNLKDGNWTTALLLRSDWPFKLGQSAGGGRKRLILRVDLPVVTTNLGADADTGLGDLYGQALYIPYLSRKFAWAVGTGLFAPTASQDAAGRGKWVLAPLAAPLWFFPNARALFYVKLQDNFSLAGNDDRADVHYTQVTPTFLCRVKQRWWVLGNAESLTDWENEARTNVISGFQLGRMFNRKVGGWVQLDLPWGGNQQIDYRLKFAVLWVRR